LSTLDINKSAFNPDNTKDSTEQAIEIYRLLAETSSDIIWQMDMDGRFTYMSPSARRFGYEPEECIGKCPTEFLPPDGWDYYDYRMALDREDPTPRRYEIRVICKDGSYAWLDVIVDFIFVDGVPVRCQGVARDITERKLAERALAATEEKYRLLAENASDILWQLDLQGRFTYMSQAITKLTGYNAEECIGRRLIEFLPTSEAERLNIHSDGFHVDLEKTSTRLIEVQAFKKDGEVIWLEVSWNVVYLDKRPVGIQGIARDITHRKHTEAALRESEQRYKSIIENSSDLIMLLKPDGLIIYMSPACKSILDYEPSEMVGTYMRPIYPDDCELVRKAFERAISGDRGTNLEYRIVRKDGGYRWVSHSWSPIFDDAGRLMMIASVIRDITERKEVDEAIRKAHDNIERAYELQRQFLNNVTHEVRTPLTAIQGYAQMILEGLTGPVNTEQAQLLKKMLTCSQDLIVMVTGVLEVARLKSGIVGLKPVVCNPYDVVEKSIAAILPQAQQKEITLNIECHQKQTMGVYDEDKLTAILTNLLSNAVKFTEQGEVCIVINPGLNGTEIIISDTGIGISESDLTNIFDEFRQLDYPGKHKPTGFGMGLTIVATLVEVIGGSLTVSSKKRIGTAFTLYVPTLDPHRQAE